VSDAAVAPDDDPATTFDAVADLLRAWNPDERTGLTLQRELRLYLKDRLQDRLDRLVSVETNTGLQSYDVVVDGAVAVKLYREFGPGVVGDFRRLTQANVTSCPFLVVFALDLPEPDLDRWRMGKLRYTASRSGYEDIAYILHGRGPEPETSSWPSTLWHYSEAIVALLAVVIGVELAVILNLQFGNLQPLVGPAATLATVVVLMTFLVLIYERTDL